VVDAATIWFKPVAAAIVEGMPSIIRSGVIRKPPPTPKRPESMPTAKPSPTGMNTLIFVRATGK
ncbi:MAG: hypothetical protein HZA07_06950, partial [Nitrospirae bacterium]|nr:hypothetical protein [Nitrospirota bacterium]